MKSMNAVRFHSYGGPEVLVYENAPQPELQPNEILIKVNAVGINPIDAKARSGEAKDWLKQRLPLIPGWDVSGIVENIGPYVTNFNVGDSVYGMLDLLRDGACADYVTARAKDMSRKPVTIDHCNAAAVPLSGLTAWQALFDIAKLAPGQTVLIHGASGGVGHFAVQLAKWKGATVIGTTSSNNMNFVRELGADEVINYQNTRFENTVKNVDVVFDLCGGETQERSWCVMKNDGILVSTHNLTSTTMPGKFGVRGETVYVHPDAALLKRLATLIDTGHLKPCINTVKNLQETAKAHEMIQTGHTRGKIVLKVCD